MPTATKKAATPAAKKPAPKPGPATAKKTTTPAKDEPVRKPGASTAAKMPAVRQNRPPASPEAVASLPAFMRDDADLGKENILREDMEVPRLKLMQGLSPELEEYDGLRPGYFFHTAAEYIFDGPFIGVPIFMSREYILWRPRDSGGGILARATDGIHWSPDHGKFEVQLDKKDGGAKVTWELAKTVQQSGLANWGTMNPADKDSPPAATLMYNYLLGFPELPDLPPAVLTFQRSSIKSGRKFNNRIQAVRAPLFGLKFEFSAGDDSNSAGQGFKNIVVKSVGMVDDEELFNNYKAMHMQLRERGLNIRDMESLQDSEGDTGAGAEPEGTPSY